ncbi:MAG: hypothetical protein H5T62_13160 [Anaerolineae bacterium]|nr:hypothetical protein [Anaerolineae bacterium]
MEIQVLTTDDPTALTTALEALHSGKVDSRAILRHGAISADITLDALRDLQRGE